MQEKYYIKEPKPWYTEKVRAKAQAEIDTYNDVVKRLKKMLEKNDEVIQ